MNLAGNRILKFVIRFMFVITGGDIGRLKDKRGIASGDSYRVLLIDDVRHTEKLGNFITILNC